MDNDKSELEYLRFVYSCLDTETRILLQNSYYKDVPGEYYIFSCETCKKALAIDVCNIKECGKLICINCRNNTCIYKKGSYCSEHLKKCSSCKTLCVCDSCRKYIVNRICNICSETYEVSYACNMCSDKSIRENTCVYCKELINIYTLERV
jgi:hypothetical protein